MAKTRRFEAHGRLAAQEAMAGRPPITSPVRAVITIDLPVPGSWSAKRQDAALRGVIRPTSPPDVDNYCKSVMDAVNGIAVTDDSLIVELTAEKRYARVPRLTISITPLSGIASNGRAA